MLMGYAAAIHSGAGPVARAGRRPLRAGKGYGKYPAAASIVSASFDIQGKWRVGKRRTRCRTGTDKREGGISRRGFSSRDRTGNGHSLSYIIPIQQTVNGDRRIRAHEEIPATSPGAIHP